MKKTLAFYLVIVSFLIPLFSISAGAETPKLDTGEVPFASGPIIRSHEIVPTIQLTNPGLIKVTITWTTPDLNFVKKVLPYEGVNYSCYGLSSEVGVVFHIVNESSIGTEATFDGDVIVTPSYTWPKEYDAYNINIKPELKNQIISIPFGQTNDAFKMVYSNNNELAGPPMALTLKADEIRDIMKATVSFEIKMEPITP